MKTIKVLLEIAPCCNDENDEKGEHLPTLKFIRAPERYLLLSRYLGDLGRAHAHQQIELMRARKRKVERMPVNTKWDFSDDRSQLLALGAGWDPEDPEAGVQKWRAKKAQDAEQIIQQLRLNRDDVVGEIGSGLGIVARRLAQVAKTVYCADVSSVFLDKCRQELDGLSNTKCVKIEPSDLSALKGLGINKLFAEGVFIHFNLFDIVIYLTQIHEILPKGGLFRFDIMNADLPNLTNHWHFLEHLNGYKSNKEAIFNCLYWNSAQTIQNIAQQIGFSTFSWGHESANGYVGFRVQKQ